MEKDNEKKRDCADEMEWEEILLPDNTNPSSTTTFNFSIKNQTLFISKLAEGSDATFQATITDDNVKEWCGANIPSDVFIDILADVLDGGGKLGSSTYLSFTPSSQDHSSSHVMTIVMKRRRKEYRIPLHTETFQLKIKIQQLEQQNESLKVMVGEKEKCIQELKQQVNDLKKEGEFLREKFTRCFVYGSDFDTAGLLYWIGTNGRKEYWKNPHSSGKIRVTTSHLMGKKSKGIREIVGRVGKNICWGTGDGPKWFMVDLGAEREIIPTHYSLRHGYEDADSSIKDWRFEGSCDGKTWMTLHRGEDPPFTKGYETKTWKVNEDCNTYFISCSMVFPLLFSSATF